MAAMAIVESSASGAPGTTKTRSAASQSTEGNLGGHSWAGLQFECVDKFACMPSSQPLIARVVGHLRMNCFATEHMQYCSYGPHALVMRGQVV